MNRVGYEYGLPGCLSIFMRSVAMAGRYDRVVVEQPKEACMEIIIVAVILFAALEIGGSRQEPFDPRPRTLYEHRPVTIEPNVPLSGVLIIAVLIIALLGFASRGTGL
jgi:hypothetical protein